MVAQAQLEQFAANILFLIGALIVLGVLFLLMIATWTGVKILIFTIRQRRAQKAWAIASRRADGKPYPTSIEGVCDLCHRGNRHIYYPEESSKGFCPACYEVFWRQVEGYDVSGFSSE